MPEEILTGRTRLRRPLPDDLEDLHALDNDPEVMRWINGGIDVDLDTFATTLMPVLLAFTPGETHGFWIAEALDPGESEASPAFIGWVSLRKVPDKPEATLGYRLNQSAWGHGYATEIAGALIRNAANEGIVDRIRATTYEKNLASQAVLLKLGFSEARRFMLETLSDTSVHDGEMWDGEDIEFVLDGAALRKTATTF